VNALSVFFNFITRHKIYVYFCTCIGLHFRKIYRLFFANYLILFDLYYVLSFAYDEQSCLITKRRGKMEKWHFWRFCCHRYTA